MGRWPIETSPGDDYDWDDERNPTLREQFDFLKTEIDGRVSLVKSRLFPEYYGSDAVWDGAAMAWHGVFGSMENMIIGGGDLSGCPDKHLRALISCVTNVVTIKNVVDGINLSKILTDIKCRELEIYGINNG